MTEYDVSDNDKGRIRDIVYKGYGDWFDAILIRLISRADTKNIERLRAIYPLVVELYEEWCINGYTVGSKLEKYYISDGE